MEYKLDALNVDGDGSYIFVSKNNRRYALINCLDFSANGDRQNRSFDICVIFDFYQPYSDGSGESHPAIVNFFFGTDIENLEEYTRTYVNMYEKENKDLLFGKKITDSMLDALNEELVAKGCLFRYVVRARSADDSIVSIERVLCDNTFIDSSIINATDEFYEWFENFFKEYGIEISYNNTGDISWAKL